MSAQVVAKDAIYVLNHCTRYLARDNEDGRHGVLGLDAGQPRASISDCWRFPVIDSHGGKDPDAYEWNDVTFVWREDDAAPVSSVELISTCHSLHQPLPLGRVGDSVFYAVTLKVPKARRHRYLFRVDGKVVLDPINPQVERLPTGERWSSFFTWAYNQPISFERHEFDLLDRLTRHVLPFNTAEARNYLEREGRWGSVGHLYRLDISAGVANFIDKLVAREERHRLYAYRTCLEMLRAVLRKRYPGIEPTRIEEPAYVRLYDEMAGEAAALFQDGWDRDRYDSPEHFLILLRRHAMTGAFAHPRHGGNPGGMAWAYLGEHFRTDQGATAFDWARALEKPLGTSEEYRG